MQITKNKKSMILLDLERNKNNFLAGMFVKRQLNSCEYK